MWSEPISIQELVRAHQVARQEHAPDSISERPASHTDPKIRSAAASSQKTTPVIFEQATPALLERLAEHHETEVVCAVADAPAVTPTILERLAGHADLSVRRAVARSRKVTPALLERLSKDPCAWVLCSVAQSEQITPEILRRLAEHLDTDVVRQVALSPRTEITPEILEHFSRHNDEHILLVIARSPQATSALLEKIARALRNPRPDFLAAILEHKNTPDPIRRDLFDPLKRHTDKLISGSLMRLRATSPFFSELSLFAEFRASEGVPTAAIDGKTLVYNPDFIGGLPRDQIDGVVLHGVLHAALMHATRRGPRDPHRWNIAAAVVVNGIIAQQKGFSLIQGAIRSPKLEHLPVEEIYEQIDKEMELAPCCLLNDECDQRCTKPQAPGGPEDYWRQALAVATRMAGSSKPLKWPAWLEKYLQSCTIEPGLDAFLDATSSNQELDNILAGHGEQSQFPKEPSLRYAFTVGLSLRVTDVEQALAAFRWLADRAAAEWLQLFVTNLLAPLEAKGLKRLFAIAIQQDPKLRALIQETYALALGGPRR